MSIEFLPIFSLNRLPLWRIKLCTPKMYATHVFYMLPQHTPTLPLQRGMKTQLGWILQASCRFQNHATSCTQCNLDSSQFLQLPVEKGKVLSLMHLNAFSDLTHDYTWPLPICQVSAVHSRFWSLQATNNSVPASYVSQGLDLCSAPCEEMHTTCNYSHSKAIRSGLTANSKRSPSERPKP